MTPEISNQQLSNPAELKAGLIRLYGVEGYYALLSSNSVFKRVYQNDRVAFLHDCFHWKPGKSPTQYQLDGLGIIDGGATRFAFQSLHGVGKTTFMAWNTLHYALTRDFEDWKLLATASAWRQLEKYYFPEVRKWARMLNWDKVGRVPFNERTELLKIQLTLQTGAASCVASDNSDLIEGAHADKLCYLFDEAKAIPAKTFDAAEGAFSGGGVGGNEALAIAASTPGEPKGRFYDICRKAAGLEKWVVRRITVEEAIKAGRVSPIWVEDMGKLWGTSSAVYRNKVKGEFAAQDENAVIPLQWIEDANARYEDLRDAGLLAMEHLPQLTAVSSDIGDGGGDLNVIAPRYGDIIHNLDYWVALPNSQISTARKIKEVIDKWGAKSTVNAIVDGIGVGSGVVSALADWKYLVISFIASGATDVKDQSGKFGFLNLRALGWWNLREALNPEGGRALALPPIPELTRDLTLPRWMEVAGAKIKIESKEDIRKRNDGKSTDLGDAVVMAFVYEHLKIKRARSW